MMDFDCRQIEAELADYHFGELAVERLGLVEAHLDDCLHCRAYLRDLEEVAGSFRDGFSTDDRMHSVTLTRDRRDAVLATAAAIDSGDT
jgi:anti-sigma factor RsiW